MTEYIMDTQYDIANGTFSTVKREEIVRCRDCAFFSVWDASAIYGNHEHDVTFCIRWIDVMRMDVEPDGSCALGVRKESSDD